MNILPMLSALKLWPRLSSDDKIRAIVANALEVIVFTAQAYTTTYADLSKIKAGTTGATDATVTLLAAASAGEGAVQQILKSDTGIGRQIIKIDATHTLDVQCLQGDLSAFRVIGGVWVPIRVCAGMIGRGFNLANLANATENVVATIPIPAGLMGIYSAVSAWVSTVCTNDAGVKTARWRLNDIGGTIIGSQTLTSTAGGVHVMRFANMGALNVQHFSLSGSGIGTSSIAPGVGAIDMSAARNLVLTLQDAGSTVNTIVKSFRAVLER